MIDSPLDIKEKLCDEDLYYEKLSKINDFLYQFKTTAKDFEKNFNYDYWFTRINSSDKEYYIKSVIIELLIINSVTKNEILEMTTEEALTYVYLFSNNK